MAEGNGFGPSFIYDAFISYRHVERDRKWAEWLIDALERYRVPKSLQERGLPPRLRKIFRDEDEVPASADLNDQIKQALTASRFLIVVCSPYTPRSKWVEREIELFNSLGRGDQVLALLTEGEPSDSFPSGMLVRACQVADSDGSTRIVKEDKEPLAADVRPRKGQSAEKLKRFALLRLVAVILGVKFDDLRQRDQERERSGKLKWAAVATAACIIFGGLGLAYWEMLAPTTTYYRQIVWRWNMPEGLGPIDQETRQHLASFYGVTTRRSGMMSSPKAVEVRHQNSAGQLVGRDSLTTDEDVRAHWVIGYREDGSVDRIKGFDAFERLIREDVLQRESSGNRYILTLERNGMPFAQSAAHVTDPISPQPNTALAQRRTEIARHELVFDGNGCVIERRYQDAWGTAVHDAAGSFGEHLTLSPEGLILRTAEIDADGAEIALKNGIRAVTWAFDRDYNLARYTLLGPDERPIDGPDGYAYYVRQLDRWGNDIATAYYHPDGNPALHKDGYTRYTVAYDNRGFQIALAYFGVDDEPALTKNGVASFRRINDDNGNTIEEDYFGTDGKPAVIKGGYARLKQVRDARGRVVEQAYQDGDGKLTLDSRGLAIIRVSFDRLGNITAVSVFGVDGEPVLSKGGHAKTESSYDKHDRLVEERYVGTDGQLVPSKPSGAAKITLSYDARGNVVAATIFGVDGKPVRFKGVDYASLAMRYDDRGNQIEKRFLDTDGKPMLTATDGLAGFSIAYDEHGNQIENTGFGLDGSPKLNNYGVAIYRYGYDARGNQTEVAYFGVDGQPKLSVDGYAGFHAVFDERGNRTRLSYFGVDGKAIASTAGLAIFALSYDAQGNNIGEAYFGVDGKPGKGKFGFASQRLVFDARGNKIAFTSFGLDGKPILNTTRTAGWRASYDARGNRVEFTFLGVDGKPALAIEGYAEYRQAFDTHGNLIERRYFGVDGKPTMLPLGEYATVVWTYDARDNLVEESYFDTDGKPANMSGCVKITYSYDDLGRLTGVTYWDAQDQPMQIEIAVGVVYAGMAGARIGLQPGDRILTYGGRKVTSIKGFEDLINEPGTSYRALTVRRGPEIILTLSVPAGSLGITLVLVRADSEHAVAPPEQQAN